MKSITLILTLTVIFGQCYNKENSEASFFEPTMKAKLSTYRAGKVVLLPTDSISEQIVAALPVQQLEQLKSILAETKNFEPTDRLKKCRFDPNIGFVLEGLYDMENLTIYFCQNCQTWKVFHGRLEMYGNYDSGQKTIDAFLNEFSSTSITKASSPPRLLTEKSELEQLLGSSIYDRIVSKSIFEVKVSLPKDSVALRFDTLGHPIDTQTFSLDKSQIEKLTSLVSNMELYDNQPWVRMCDEPIAAMLHIANIEGESTYVFISPKCGQVSFGIGHERRTLSCPVLIQNISKLISNHF